MADIFDKKILCNECDREMVNELITKNGFNLRSKNCKSCGERIIHPADMYEYEEFMKLKKKDFEVKMRMVGNSYAVSIPREIVDFLKEQERMINNMVKLSFEEAGRISLMFNTQENDNHIVSAKEVRIMRNGKPVLHARKFTDNKDPSKNRTQIIKNTEEEGEE